MRKISALVAILLVAAGCGLMSDSGSPKFDAQEYFPADVELAQTVASGTSEQVSNLLAAGADPNTQGPDAHSLVQWAMLNGNIPALSALLVGGADPDLAAAGGQRPLHSAVSIDVGYSIGDQAIPLLLDAGADVDAANTITGATALGTAAVTGSDQAFKALLAAGADPNLGDRNSSYPLHDAARVNKGAHILLLLEAGADPVVTTSTGTTFQDFYFGYDKSLLNERALAERAAVADWLTTNGYELNPEA